MSELKITSKIIRNQNIMASDMDGEMVMMNVETGKYYNIGKTGGVIWGMLKNPITVAELVSKLTDKFDVSKDQCEADIMPFMNKMLEQKLIDIQ